MSNVFTYRMPAGIPGNVTRLEDATIVTELFASSNHPTVFGCPVKLSSGKIAKLTGSEAAADIIGLLVRPYPMQRSTNEALGTATPDITKPADILKRGFMTVKMAFGTAAKGDQVYVCVSASGGNAIGDIGDSSDSSHCVQPTGWKFRGPADADRNVEIEVNL